MEFSFTQHAIFDSQGSDPLLSEPYLAKMTACMKIQYYITVSRKMLLLPRMTMEINILYPYSH